MSDRTPSKKSENKMTVNDNMRTSPRKSEVHPSQPFECFYTCRTDTTITFASSSFHILGYKPDDLVGQKLTSIIHSDDPLGSKKSFKHWISHSEHFEHCSRIKSAKGRWIQVRNKIYITRNNEDIIQITGVISRLDGQSEEALHTSQIQLTNALRIAKLAYWEYDVAEGLFYFNDQFYALFRTSVKEIGGYTMRPSEYADRFLPKSEHYIFTAEVNKALSTDDPNFSRKLEHQIIYGDGELGYISVRYFVEKDESGKTIRTYGANQDITERKRAEQEMVKLELQLRRSQKLETIGTLAGGIAHDFNNLLTPILGYADLARMRLEPGNSLYDDLGEIIIGAKRAKDLVEQILTFSRQIERERQPLALQFIVSEALKLLRPTIPSTIEIHQNIDLECDRILADPSQMHQIIVNLCTNAFQTMENTGGILFIELNQVKLTEEDVKYLSHLIPGDYVQLSVNDTGAGIDAALLDRIFEPFFTTKSVNKGTGMGLAVVHGIVRSHQGDITVSSVVGQGSTFTVFLPVMKKDIEAVHKDAEEIRGGIESILIVDDEQPVANVVGRMLTKLGYHVSIVESGKTAIKTIHQSRKKFDLVITDLTMPQITGLDLARHLFKIDPKLPVVLMTGYGVNNTAVIEKYENIRNIVGKPIILNELAPCVREVLDAASKTKTKTN